MTAVQIRLRPAPREEHRAATCPHCHAAFQQARVIASTWNAEANGWDDRLVWRPRTCPPCERRAQWGER